MTRRTRFLTITGSLKLHTFEHEEVLFLTKDLGMVRNNKVRCRGKHLPNHFKNTFKYLLSLYKISKARVTGGLYKLYRGVIRDMRTYVINPLLGVLFSY